MSDQLPVLVPHTTVIQGDEPVLSRPTPFWKRWGPLEWGAAVGLAGGVLGGLGMIANSTMGISMELHDHSRDIQQIKIDQSDIKDTQKDQGKDTKKILWFLAEDYKHKNDESRAPTTRPFLARNESGIEGLIP